MSDLLLSIDKDDVNNHNKSSNPIHSSTELTGDEEKQKQIQQQINCISEFKYAENDSFFAVIKRLCFYWRRLLLQKIRVVLTLVFVSMLNITTRITCFTRHRTPLSSSSHHSSVSSSSIETLEEDLKSSPKSPLLIENTHKQQIDLLSLENPTMAHILIQQKTHRTPNININRSTTSQKDTTLLMRHSVDDRLFLHGSTQLLHLLTRFASEPQISKHNSQLTNSNRQLLKPLQNCTITLPISNYKKSENDEIHFEEIFIFNCDQIEPEPMFNTENFTSDKIDNIISATDDSSSKTITIQDVLTPLQLNGNCVTSDTNQDLKISQSNDKLTTLLVKEEVIISEINNDSKTAPLNEDILIDTSSSLNETDAPSERHFRRRRRRSSLTKTPSVEETQSTTDLIEKVNNNNTNNNIEPVQVPKETLKLTENDDKENKNVIEKETSENKEPIQASDEADKSTPLSSRYRGRRLRHRFYRQAAENSSPQESPKNVSKEFYLPNAALDVEMPAIPKPTSPLPINTLSVSVSPTMIPPSKPPTNTTSGGLRRVRSTSAKKSVRFADSVGRELAQVQYINSQCNDESQELSFLLGSSILSSSPPPFTKSNLYLPATSTLEHKPWSFDLVSKPAKQSSDKSALKRFYCLYRQPSSEHPDIYLHEVWKSQIKLEHAEIPFKCFATGEQKLYGSIWVTNAGYQKYVSVKYTFNNWLNVYEHEAQYSHHSNDFRNLDKFQFTISVPTDVDRIEFVLRYCVNGQEYWDNNLGKNYTIQTDSSYKTSTTISLPHDCDLNEMRFY